MSQLTLSQNSPTNTTLTDPYGTVVYEVSTPHKFGGSTTTIKRNGQTLATIKWGMFGSGELTMGGMTASLSNVFPKAGMLSNSRVFTTASGERLKWKDKSKLSCVSDDTGKPLATYNRKSFAALRSKKSTLDISSNGTHFTDILVVTWVLAEKKAQDRRRSGGDGDGGGDGGGGGGGDGGGGGGG